MDPCLDHHSGAVLRCVDHAVAYVVPTALLLPCAFGAEDRMNPVRVTDPVGREGFGEGAIRRHTHAGYNVFITWRLLR